MPEIEATRLVLAPLSTMVTVKVRVMMLLLFAPLLTVTEMVAVPVEEPGRKVKEPLVLGLMYKTLGRETNRWLLEMAVTRSLRFLLVVPELMPVKVILCTGAPALTTTLEMGSNVGDWLVGPALTALTLIVTLKVRVMMLLLAPPSLTVTLMSDVPAVLVTEVKVNLPVVLPLV
jgi:hypothetical protein